MKKKVIQPLLRKAHLPLILLGAALTLYGVVTALVSGQFASMAMRGLISPGEYRARLAGFEQIAGLIAAVLFLALFIWCAAQARGAVRVAFAIGAVSALAPSLSGRAEDLLFGRLGLPTMSAGSVLAGAIATLLFALPVIILFIILASSGKVPRGCRWLSVLAILVVLATAFYPIYVTVLAFLVRPGDPVVGRMIETSTQVIKLRFLLPGLFFLALAFVSARFARAHPAEAA